jgi:hypothetical protein
MAQHPLLLEKTMRSPIRTASWLAWLLYLPTMQLHAIDAPPPTGAWYEDARMLLRLAPRTPAQMAAFYEARGFPPAALDRIRQTCFITLTVRNEGKEVLWVDLGQWKFSSHGKPVARLDLNYWQQQWDGINLRQASRSTFGWTQFPPVRDLQPDEPVGGNLVFPGNLDSVTIEAVLQSGADRTPVRLGFSNIPCLKGETAS